MANIYNQIDKLNKAADQRAFNFNAKEAAKERTWSKEMSNTAHQREVKDLVLAGLNPALSAGGSGAAAYAGASASGVSHSSADAVASVKMNKQRISADKLMNSKTLKNNLKVAKLGYNSAALTSSATRYAAAQSAAATKYAAAQAAAAQTTAAALNSSAAKYASDNALAGTKYQTDYNKNGNAYGLASNLWNDMVKNPNKDPKQGLPK